MTIHSTRVDGCGAAGPPVDVTVWRRCRLLEAGFDADLAGRLAADRRVDVHALLQLVDRGCRGGPRGGAWWGRGRAGPGGGGGPFAVAGVRAPRSRWALLFPPFF